MLNQSIATTAAPSTTVEVSVMRRMITNDDEDDSNITISGIIIKFVIFKDMNCVFVSVATLPLHHNRTLQLNST